MPTPKPDAAALSEDAVSAVKREAIFQAEKGCGFADCVDCSIMARGRTILALLAEREEARDLLAEALPKISGRIGVNDIECEALRKRIRAHLSGKSDSKGGG